MVESLNLFDKSPEDFSIYLKELEQQGLPRDQLDFVRKEYQRYQGGLKDPFAEPNKELAQQGRERADLLPVSKPKGKSVVEAFKEGSLKPAVPGIVTEGVGASVDAVNTPSNLSKGVPYSKSDLEESAVNAAGMTMGVGAAAPVPKGALRTFGGLNARDRDRGAFAEAKDLLDSGVDQDVVLKKTGWFKDPIDKKWRFEIDDSKSKFIDASDEVVNATLGEGAKLSEVFQHEELFRQYPELADVKFQVADLGADYGIANSDTIILNKKLSGDKARATLLHEIQHMIQTSEGFSEGSNVQFVLDKHPAVIKARKEGKSLEELNQLAFRFYEGKNGEIEARLVEDRMDMPADLRRIYPPRLSREAIAGDKEFRNAFGDLGLKPGVSDIIAEPNIFESVFDRTELGREIKGLTPGTKIGDNTFHGFAYVNPRSLKELPTRGIEIRDKDGYIAVMNFVTPKGDILSKPLSQILQEAGENLEDWRP